MMHRPLAAAATRAALCLSLAAGAAACRRAAPDATPAPAASAALEGAIGTRVLVVERASGSLAVYDYAERKLLEHRIEGLGDLKHATVTMTPDLRWGFLATRSGMLTRIDLQTLQPTGKLQTSENSIDNAVSHDSRTVAVAEYAPGGLTLVDARTMTVRAKLAGEFVKDGKTLPSRVTGVVDIPGNRFACALIEGQQIWIVDPNRAADPIVQRIPSGEGLAYDAMVTADGRHYVVGKLGAATVSVLDLSRPEAGVREVSLADPAAPTEAAVPRKLPHMASWAQAGRWVFVPLVGEKRLAVLDRDTFAFSRSVPVRGHPVYAVRSPTEREVWVSFSGEADDAWIDVIDVATLTVARSFEVGKRIYHLDFTPRGSHALVTANGADQLLLLDATTYAVVDRVRVPSPSGVFGAWRAFRLGL